jgi:hypothetical protein
MRTFGAPASDPVEGGPNAGIETPAARRHGASISGPWQESRPKLEGHESFCAAT